MELNNFLRVEATTDQKILALRIAMSIYCTDNFYSYYSGGDKDTYALAFENIMYKYDIQDVSFFDTGDKLQDKYKRELMSKYKQEIDEEFNNIVNMCEKKVKLFDDMLLELNNKIDELELDRENNDCQYYNTYKDTNKEYHIVEKTEPRIRVNDEDFLKN